MASKAMWEVDPETRSKVGDAMLLLLFLFGFLSPRCQAGLLDPRVLLRYLLGDGIGNMEDWAPWSNEETLPEVNTIP